MAGEVQAVAPEQEQQAPEVKKPERSVSPQDEKLAADYLKRIEAAKTRPAFKEAVDIFRRNRKLLRGIDPDTNKRMRSNIHFANLAMMRPQVYAKDPEFSVKPSAGVDEARLEATKAFATTCEAVLTAELVKGCDLKRKAKRLLTSAFTTAVGWWKLAYQENKQTDPLILNQIKDMQDELMRLEAARAQLDDPNSRADTELQTARIQQMIAGLQSKSEVAVAFGLTLDFVLSEDVIILDASVRELGDYRRASAIAHRVWMTRAAFRTKFGFDPKGKTFSEASSGAVAQPAAGNAQRSPEDDLFEVFEVWDQDSSRVLHVCSGEKGFLDDPMSPDWTGERWYPFFALMFNETDGDMFPLSDIELTEPLVKEYNEARDDLVKDRRDTRPFTVVRKGGALTQKDVDNFRNRGDNDIILVEGVGNQPIQSDIQAITLGKIDPSNYNTQPARADIEQLIGGGDAARGSVLEAKTATEAEILSQGLRGRSAERQDIVEDLLTEVGTCALEICLRKMTPEQVQGIVGSNAQWPAVASVDQIFRQITLDVRGGSTGKPDRLQDQDRWTKLLPVIEKTIEQVSELRAKGQDQLADALITLTRETLRRFDERLDIEQFLPPKDAKTGVDPAAVAQENAQLKQQVQEQGDELTKLKQEQEKTEMSTAATLATAANPVIALQAFQQALQIIEQHENGESGEVGQPGQPNPLMQALGAAMQQQPPGAQPGAEPPLPVPQMPAQTGPDQPQPQ